MTTYQYEDALRSDFSEIRLLSILPQSHEDCCNQASKLHCSMTRASLEDAPSYTALSYTWGSPNFTQKICINGRCFQVTKNLESALLHLQQRNDTIVLWIDAVCLNQMDNEEQSHQVQQMRRIYEEAQLVLIWLGVAGNKCDLAMDKLKKFGEQYAKRAVIRRWEWKNYISRWIHHIVSFQTDDEPGELTLEQILSKVTFNDDPRATLPSPPIISLLRRPWWQRIWVVQELAVAEKAVFMCGEKSIDADHMSTAVMIFRLAVQAAHGTLYVSPRDFVSPGIDSRPYLMLGSLRMKEYRAKLQLLNLIQAAFPYMENRRRLRATDPRDVIFALSGLSSDSGSLGIRPDYDENCPQVFSRTARALINKHCSLELLRDCFFPKLHSQLPSWIPDWSAESVGRRLRIGQSEHGNGIEVGRD